MHVNQEGEERFGINDITGRGWMTLGEGGVMDILAMLQEDLTV